MERIYSVFAPRSGAPSVLIEVQGDPAIDLQRAKALLASFKRTLFHRQVRIGMLITPAVSFFLRDSLKSLSFTADSFETHELKTPVLFERTHPAGGREPDLLVKTREWLSAVGESWDDAVPNAYTAIMIPELVACLSGPDLYIEEEEPESEEPNRLARAV